MMTESELALWEEYKRTKDIKIRDTLFKQYMPLALHIASKIPLNRYSILEFGDILSFAHQGLLDAIETFDITKKLNFTTYSYKRIHGAIYDEIRRIYKRFNTPESEMAKDLILNENIYSIEELHEKTGCSKEMIQTIINYFNICNSYSLDRIIKMDDGDTTTAGENIKYMTYEECYKYSPEEQFIKQEEIRIMKQSIEALGEKLKNVIISHYFYKLSLKEIGVIFGVTESRISQMHKEALRILNKMLYQQLGELYESYESYNYQVG